MRPQDYVKCIGLKELEPVALTTCSLYKEKLCLIIK